MQQLCAIAAIAKRCSGSLPSRPCFRAPPNLSWACSSSGRRLELAALEDVEVEVVSPVGLPPLAALPPPPLCAARKAARARGMERPHGPSAALSSSAEGRSGPLGAIDGAGAAAGASRDSPALPVRCDRRRILLARRPGGDAAREGAGSALSRSRPAVPIFNIGDSGPAPAARSSPPRARRTGC